MKLVCKYCKNNFEGRKEKLFCSKLCYTKWAKGKRFGKGKPQNRRISTCKICNKKFEHWAGRSAKYCSRQCWSKRNPKMLFYCLACGKEFWDWRTNREGNNIFCSKGCANSFNQRGSRSHFWKGGKTKLSKLLRTRSEYLNWRQKVFERDNYICQKCGVRSGNGKKIFLQAHHLKEFHKFPKLIYEVSNGITLCKNCHLLEHTHKF